MYQDKPPVNELYSLIFESDEDLVHYGMPRRSGRYPWGSGKDPYQHSGDFLSRVQELRDQNFTYTDPDTGKSYSGDTAIAKSMGLTTTQFRTQVGLANDEQRALKVATAKGLKEKGYSNTEIGRQMGINESSVRSLLNAKSEAKMNQARGIANDLKKRVDEVGMIDVGGEVNRELNISKEKMDQALEILRMEGYPTYGGRVPQVNNKSQQTTLKVLCPPGTEHKEIYNYENIHSLKDYISRDGETLTKKFVYPESMDSNRLMIRYKEDGGIDRDGLVEIRRGVPDLSLGESHYSQVRILVDGNKYIKGMAVYGEDKDFPPGVDVIFNTNKDKSVAKLDVLKDIKRKADGTPEDNPFGASVKDIDKGGQYFYKDKDGNQKLGLINKRADEGDWTDWKDKLPSQFLSKQSTTLAKRQLGLAIKDKTDEYNDICSLTNPTVKKKLLEDFANNCDSASVHLYAAALPRQKYHVIVPINTLKDTEIYAPKYDDGEKLALVRYPHGGTFEIPVLTVNNKNKLGNSFIGKDSIDAVGINKNIADILSGADFDGDTVMVIPTNDKVKINHRKPLAGLEGFDPKMEYPTVKSNETYKDSKGKTQYYYINKDGVKVKPMRNTQNEMGKISNLITDMTLQGASDDELARAVRHSMVVIDAEKHHLDYRQSAIDNNIAALKKRYQNGGASTLISRAKAETSIPKTQGSPKINTKYKKNGTLNPDYDPNRPEGALIYKTSDDLYYAKAAYKKNKQTGKTESVTYYTTDGRKISYSVDDKEAAAKYRPIQKKDPKTGEVIFTNAAGDISYKVEMKLKKSTQMEDTDDARTLISKADTQMENIYADYANKMKAMANNARKEMLSTGSIKYDKNAASTYSKEVASLQAKLNESLKNKPKERQAQLIANSVISAKKKENPEMTKDEIKKLGQRELTKARAKVGAERTLISVTDKEWEAIQAGAISENKLKKILDNCDMDIIRDKATPKNRTTLSNAKQNRISAMRNSGYSVNEIANALGVSTSTVSNYLRGKE